MTCNIDVFFLFISRNVLNGLESDFLKFILHGGDDPCDTICVIVVKDDANEIQEVEIFQNNIDSIPEEALRYLRERRDPKIQLYINKNCQNIPDALMKKVTEIKLADEVNLPDQRVTQIEGDDWVSLFKCLHWKIYSMPYMYRKEDTSFEKEDEFMRSDWQNLFEN